MRARASILYAREIETLLFELSHTGPISQEMRKLVEPFVRKAMAEPGVRRKAMTEEMGYGVQWTFQSGVPADEPYRVLLMAIRRRLHKSRVRPLPRP